MFEEFHARGEVNCKENPAPAMWPGQVARYRSFCT
jgi:hypothetical protein